MLPRLKHLIQNDKITSKDIGAFGSLDVILQCDNRFLEFVIHGITSWKYKIMVFDSLSHSNEIPLMYHSYV